MTLSADAPRRVYLRLDADALRRLAGGQVDVPGGRAYAVTALVRAAFPDQDEEELEYEAMCAAAQAPSVGASAGDRVVVVAADVPAAHARDLPPNAVDAQVGAPIDADRAYAIELTGALRRPRVVALHVQEHAGEPDAELLWYDVSELDALL